MSGQSLAVSSRSQPLAAAVGVVPTSRWPFALLCLVCLAACGEAAGPQPLSGRWSHSETFGYCTSTGTLTITPSATGFAGTVSLGVCATALGVFRGPRDSPRDDSISEGQVSGATITFRTATCAYRGTISGSRADLMNGTVSCSEVGWGAYSGTWRSSR